ncbi:hypothetical protein DH2020_040858 [Rehmannia glutinosa]|uniref:Reverse transcriptase zinc-binding domain-containing protein n=1 Tax=Rehmannia glutinosa TaxID=99300 RepID=A0ABR0URR3_REHGL
MGLPCGIGHQRKEILPSSSASLKFGTSLSVKKGLPSLLLPTLIGGSQGKILVARKHMNISDRGAFRKFGQMKFGDITFLPNIHLSFGLYQGRLQTKDRLHYMDIDQNCALCGTAPETLDHLFFQCNMTNQVWLQIKKWLCITRAMTTIKSALKYMKKEARGTSWQSCAKKSAVACTVYHI